MKYISLLSMFLVSQLALAAGSVTVTRANFAKSEVVTINWTADSADGSVPDTTLGLYGTCVKIVTNPGSTAPTANYDMVINDPEATVDALAGALANRHTSNTEQVYPTIAGSPGTVSAVSPFLTGTYTFSLSNNSVNSATGKVVIYLVKP